MANPHGTVTCCGYVTAWDAYVKGHGHLRLQVWRPIPGRPGMYTLLGENGFQAKSEWWYRNKQNMSRVLRKLGIMHVRKVSSQISL
ncbi:hypothetical protein DPMN_069325 [Dreissena polymorpha]|uniref:Uncharacterized protein n=1 Tax=Dreissena polymorpha TaxID=45954 RepID=A0A9D3YYW3_DREPO|nr:hypothetical protein DPMN_069325 [Dreissena polymorpha]